MIIAYSQEEFKAARTGDFLNLKCEHCGNDFVKKKEIITLVLNNPLKYTCKFCSKKCQTNGQLKQVKVNCRQCNKEFYKIKSQFLSYPNSYCDHSCAATYNNTHKTKGTRRSKLEKYLQEKLALLYPSLEVHYCRKDAINSELDIYIPSLNLAFELNGIFHYEPIFGEEKLKGIKNNDTRKFQACLEKGIELCIIDSSKLAYFIERNAKPYLDIVVNIINQKLVPRPEFESGT